MSHPRDKGTHSSYEIGYGKPPAKGRFAKGQSGNPRGRPRKTPVKPKIIDPSIRDRFLRMAESLVQSREGQKVPISDGVRHAEAAAALKGNVQAQKHFLDRQERFTADLIAEIREDHEAWRSYIADYRKIEKAGQAIPPEWFHPDDLIFADGSHVMVRGGDPIEATRARQYLLRLRDLWLLQAEMHRRDAGPKSSVRDLPILTSEVLALLINQRLPTRLQLSDSDLFWRTLGHGGLKKRVLERQLKQAWADFGFRKTPACSPVPIEALLSKLGIDLHQLAVARARASAI